MAAAAGGGAGGGGRGPAGGGRQPALGRAAARAAGRGRGPDCLQEDARQDIPAEGRVETPGAQGRQCVVTSAADD